MCRFCCRVVRMRVTCEEVETTDGRLCYELVRGDGPATGWVSMKLRGRVTRHGIVA